MSQAKLTDEELSDINAARSQELARETAWRKWQAAQNAALTMRLANRVSGSRKVRPDAMGRWLKNVGLLAAVVATGGALVIFLGWVKP